MGDVLALADRPRHLLHPHRSNLHCRHGLFHSSNLSSPAVSSPDDDGSGLVFLGSVLSTRGGSLPTTTCLHKSEDQYHLLMVVSGKGSWLGLDCILSGPICRAPNARFECKNAQGLYPAGGNGVEEGNSA
jgi:hypothetical protein